MSVETEKGTEQEVASQAEAESAPQTPEAVLKNLVANIQATLLNTFQTYVKAGPDANGTDWARTLVAAVQGITASEMRDICDKKGFWNLKGHYIRLNTKVGVKRQIEFSGAQALWSSVDAMRKAEVDKTHGAATAKERKFSYKQAADTDIAHLVAEVQKTAFPALEAKKAAPRATTTTTTKAEATATGTVEELRTHLRTLREQLPEKRTAFIKDASAERAYRKLQHDIARAMYALKRAQLEKPGTLSEERIKQSLTEFKRTDIFNEMIVKEYERETAERARLYPRGQGAIEQLKKFLYEKRKWIIPVIMGTLAVGSLLHLVPALGIASALVGADATTTLMSMFASGIVWSLPKIRNIPDWLGKQIAKIFARSDEHFEKKANNLRGGFEGDSDFAKVARAYAKNQSKVGTRDAVANVINIPLRLAIMYGTAATIAHGLPVMQEHYAPGATTTVDGVPQPVGRGENNSLNSILDRDGGIPNIAENVNPTPPEVRAYMVNRGGYGIQNADGEVVYKSLVKGWLGALNIEAPTAPLEHVPILDQATGQWTLDGKVIGTQPMSFDPGVEGIPVETGGGELLPAESNHLEIPVETGVQAGAGASLEAFTATHPHLTAQEAAVAWSTLGNHIDVQWADMLHSGVHNMQNDFALLGDPTVHDVYAEHSPTNMAESDMTPEKVAAWGRVHAFLHAHEAELGIESNNPTTERLSVHFKNNGFA